MIKQTRGALSFLIASYKAILKHSVVFAAVASVAVVSVANAKTYDLSDDSTFNSALVSIIDENDTIINKTINPNYTGTRDIYSLVVKKGNMKFTNGGKLNVTKQVVLSGGSLDESNTDIVTALLFMNNIQNSATPTYLKRGSQK